MVVKMCIGDVGFSSGRAHLSFFPPGCNFLAEAGQVRVFRPKQISGSKAGVGGRGHLLRQQGFSCSPGMYHHRVGEICCLVLL